MNETIRGNIFSVLSAANPSAPPLPLAPRRTTTGNVRSAERVDDDPVRLEKQGGVVKWISIALMILGIGGGAAYYFIVFVPQQELADAEKAELAVIEEFLPSQMDEAATSAAIEAIKAELGASGVKDMGKVMGELKARHGTELDMSKTSAMVKAALA